MTAINDPHYWYELARRTFTQAKAETNKSLRDTMYAIAVSYHRLAEWTEYHSASAFWNAELIYGRKPKPDQP